MNLIRKTLKKVAAEYLNIETEPTFLECELKSELNLFCWDEAAYIILFKLYPLPYIHNTLH